MSRRKGKAPIDPEQQQRLRDEQQRLWDEAEARRLEERRLEIEREPNPAEVLQYVNPPLPNRRFPKHRNVLLYFNIFSGVFRNAIKL